MKKRSFLFWALFLILTSSGYAQKFGFIDSERILNKMEDYKKAQQELNKVAKQWQEELDKMRSEIDGLSRRYQTESILLTDEMKKERMDTISAREKQLRERQNMYFGYEGMLFFKKQELIKPVQDKMYDAVEKVARQNKLQFIFDRSSDLVMIYTDPIHDYTDKVLEALGLGDPVDTVQK